MKVKNPVSQNIRIFPKINQKNKKNKRICKIEKFFKVCSFVGLTVSHLSLENIP